MKNKKILIMTVLGLFFGSLASSQNENPGNHLFVRVYNTYGKKIAKGKIVSINDSGMSLKRNEKHVELKMNNIGKIKTKRSAGHSVLVGAITGGALLAIIGAASSEEETKTRTVPIIGEYEYTDGTSPGEGAAMGGAIGAAGGAAIGGLVSAFKNSQTFIIEGSQENWNEFVVKIQDEI